MANQGRFQGFSLRWGIPCEEEALEREIRISFLDMLCLS